MASKICGHYAGVAKQTTIIPVKVGEPGFIDLATFFEAWSRIVQDIRRRRAMNPSTATPGKTIVNISSGATPINILADMALTATLKQHINALIGLDVIIVAAAGNSAKDQNSAEIRSYPAKLAAPNLPIIVASSLNTQFGISSFSNYGPQTCVWGIGEGCVLAVNRGTDFYQADGTSYGKFQIMIFSSNHD